MICNRILLLGACVVYSVGALAKGVEKIALAGSYVEHVAIVDKVSGKAEWRYDLPKGAECNTIAVTKGGDVLLSYKEGVRLVDRATKSTLWDFVVPEGQEAQTARLIDGGKRVLVGVCAVPEMRVVELDAKTGKVLVEVNYDLCVAKPHGQFRQICKTEVGTYLVPVISQGRVVELDAKGVKINEWKVPSTPFSVKELPGGKGILVSTLSSVVEIDRSKPDLLRVVAQKVVGSDSLRFCTEVARLANGHTILANWHGYQPKATDAQLIEWDASGKVVYRFSDTTVMRHVSGFYTFKE